jgi:hypothetical protein
MNQHRTLEMLVNQTLEVEPSAAEREAVWRSITEQLGEQQELPPVRRHPRRRRLPRLAAVGLAAVAIGLAIVTLLPTADESGGPLPRASEAQAAAILNATATSAGSALPAVGPGQYLFARTSTTIRGEGAISVDTKSWTATDGSGWIVSHERSSRGSETSTTSYRAGSDTALHTEDGVERRYAPTLGWRAVVPGAEVGRLPAERDALLASLREGAERAVREYRDRVRAAQAAGKDRNHYPIFREIERSGHDLIVVETVTDLLVEAPISPDQRAALFSLLADAPDWYQPGSGAEPILVRNLGPTEDDLGRNGTAVRVGAFDLVLDPGAGRLLETRSYEHGLGGEPVRLTLEAQRVVDSIDR